jgi:uncharacterized protein (TIGR02466 family)|tara:strand:+ start:2518 stop:3117 length:600 start_codon:yes stop_codon:yes gene_type:complete
MPTQLNYHALFPTNIWLSDNVLKESENKALKKSVLKSYDSKKPYWQSKDSLQKEKPYSTLVNKVNESSNIIFKNSDLIYSSFKITGMWANVLRKNETHTPHTHANNFLSGVYYVQSNDSSITFVDSRAQAGVIRPKVKNFNKENSSAWSFPAKENRIIFFPSWLQHYVPPYTKEDLRISIAFNIMFKGLAGDRFESNDF